MYKIVIAIVTLIENLLCARQKYTHTHTEILFILAKIPWEKHFFKMMKLRLNVAGFHIRFDSRAQIFFMYLLHFLALPPWIFYSVQTNSSYMCLFPIFLSIPFAPPTSNSGNVFHAHFFLNFTNLSENSLITTSSMRPFLNLQPK